jgi:hypothetical protein
MFLSLWVGSALAARLIQPVGHFQYPASFGFILECDESEVYLIQRSTNLTDWTPWGISRSGQSNRVISFSGSDLGPKKAFFRAVSTTHSPVFAGAIVAMDGIDLNGITPLVDSFDSADPLRSTDGRYDPQKASDRGDILSNDTVTNVITLGDARIYGRVHTGPSGTISLGTNACVGSLAWQSNPTNLGSIEPGWSLGDVNIYFPEVMPSFTNGAAPLRNFTFEGVLYDYFFPTNGDYVLTSTLTGKVLIGANVRILAQDINVTGAGYVRLTNDAIVSLFNTGPSAYFGGYGIINPYTVTNFMYFGTSQNSVVDIRSRGPSAAVFYAPSADVTIGASPLMPLEFSGSLFVKSVRTVGHFKFHFDEALTRVWLRY